MTKRFTKEINVFLTQFYDNGVQINSEDLLTVANELNDENEQLKSFKEQNINEYLKLKEVCNECKKENEKLKQENEWLKQSNKNLEKIAYPMARWKGDVE